MSQALIEKLRKYMEFDEDEERFIRSMIKPKALARTFHVWLDSERTFSAMDLTFQTSSV